MANIKCVESICLYMFILSLLKHILAVTCDNTLLSVSQDMGGRQFISVLDLEGDVLNQELPPCVSLGVLDSIRPSSPTSAELHVLATSVIRSAGAAASDDPQPSDIITQNPLKPTTHPGLFLKFLYNYVFIFNITKPVVKHCCKMCYIYLLYTLL